LLCLRIFIQGAVTITGKDASLVQPGEMFNDALVDFRLHTLFYGDSSIHPDHDPLTSDQVHIFSSMFFSKLTRGDPAKGILFNEVNTWTKRIRGGLFSKRMILIPITPCGDMHWSLVVVCNPSSSNLLLESANSDTSPRCALDMLPPFILHMDSLSGIHNTEVITNLIIAYLEEEKKSTGISQTCATNITEFIAIDGRSFVSTYL